MAMAAGTDGEAAMRSSQAYAKLEEYMTEELTILSRRKVNISLKLESWTE